MVTLMAIAQALGVKTFDLFNVEHATNEVAGLLEDLRGEPAEKIQAARVALQGERGRERQGECDGLGLGCCRPPSLMARRTAWMTCCLAAASRSSSP
jgi:hypothetical protein